MTYTYRNLNDTVIEVYKDNTLAHNLTVNFSGSYSIEHSQILYQDFLENEVSFSFPFGRGERFVYILNNSDYRENAFTISFLRRKKKGELVEIIEDLGMGDFFTEDLSKAELINELKDLSKGSYLKNLFDEQGFNAINYEHPFPCQIRSICGFSQGEESFIVSFSKDRLDYEYYQNILYSCPVDFKIEVVGDDIELEIGNNVLSDLYIWDKKEAMEAVSVSGEGYTDVLLEILDKRIPETLTFF